MLSNPLDRVAFRNKALDYFRFAIGPQNIHPQPSPGFFRAMKIGRCSNIRRICAYGAPVQASYPAAIKLSHTVPASARQAGPVRFMCNV